MEKWFIKNKPGDLEKIRKNNKISMFLSKLLVNRGINDERLIDSYLHPDLNKMYSPSLMKDIDKGVNIIRRNILKGEKIRIVGDYDVDGVISIYTLYKSIKRCRGIVDYVIPNRVDDGYGINDDIVMSAKRDGITTILTCDNGISAIEPIALAKQLGLTVIVTDHHDVPFKINESLETEFIHTDADAVINPKQIDCTYPFKLLCGAGISFKFIEHLYSSFDVPVEEAYKLLEYTAIATICDVVDLIDENRIIVKTGLEILNKTKNIGLKALIRETGIEQKEIQVYHVGFVIGPSINATGRLDSAITALELLLCNNQETANLLAKELKGLNEERKMMTIEGVEKAYKSISDKSLGGDKILVIYEPDIHESIAGIVAGRIKDKENKPTIILTKGKHGVKGSARSIEEYNVFEELSKCKDILLRFGGHPMAAGLTLAFSNVDILRKRLNTSTTLTDNDLVVKKYIDMQLPLDYISFKIIDELEILEPFGKGNEKPLFGEKNLRIKKAFILGKDKNVLKLILQNNKMMEMEAIYFNDVNNFQVAIEDVFGKDELEKLYKGIDNCINLDILYYPNINEYMGNKNIQIVIQSFRIRK